jgi:hypothetical protein
MVDVLFELKATAQRVCSPFREFGLLAGMLYSIDRLLGRMRTGWALRVYEIMVQPIPEQGDLLPERLAQHFVICEIPNGAMELSSMPVPAHVLASRHEQGATCLGAFRRGELIGYIWFVPKRYLEDEVRCVFELRPLDQAVFDFDLYIFPAHRLGLGFVAIWNGANRYLRERGVRYTYSRVTRFNLPSRRAHRYLGSKMLGRAVFLQIGSLELMVSTLPPFVHLSCDDSSRVVLALHPGEISR